MVAMAAHNSLDLTWSVLSSLVSSLPAGGGERAEQGGGGRERREGEEGEGGGGRGKYKL